jgi:hypothetical protein
MPAPTAGSTPSRSTVELVALQCVDVFTYSLALVGVVAVPVGALELLTLGGLVFTKWVLFVLGGALLMVAGLKLRPASPERRTAAASAGPSGDSLGGEDLSWLQRTGAKVPSALDLGLEPHERFPPSAKLLVGSIVMLGVSFAMEALFGVALT